MYENFTDEQLLDFIKDKNEQAQDFLINKYKQLVKIKARAYFATGLDKEDIIQEGMIGLYKAIRDYKQGASFKTFASLCIDRQIITAIKTANRKKQSVLNSSLSLDTFISDEENKTTYVDNLEDNLLNPEKIFIDKENILNLEEEINKILSSFEKTVLSLYLKGESYTYISKKLDKNEKSIDNAIQRIRKKIYKLIYKNNNKEK